MSLFSELKRRNVIRVAVAYLVLSWLLLQVGEVIFDFLEVPGWAGKLLLTLLALAFLPTVVFAWAFELTPEGIKRDRDVDRQASITGETGRKLDYVTMGMVILGVAFLLVDRYLLEAPRANETATAAGAENDSPAGAELAGRPTANDSALKGVEEQASIAVLPFADLSPEGDQEYFADGISEELLNVLVGIEGLKVASRTSSFAYKGLNTSIVDIAKDLRVGHVLEGSVRKARDRVRITAQLIDASTDRHLWSETYDRDLNDIFAIQEDIAEAILAALQDVLNIADPAAAVQVAAKTENLDAYQLYLEGRALFHKRQDLERAIEVLEQSVELDPGFAKGWEQLAAIYGIVESWGIRDRAYNSLALDAADRALAIDPGLSMPHAVKGNVAFEIARDWERSFEHLDRAIEADPRNATAYLWRGISWIQLGFFDRARADIERCLAIDPAYGNCRKRLALLALLSGDDERALELFRAAELEGNQSLTPRFLPLLLRSGDRYAAYLLLRGDFFVSSEASNELPVSLILDALGGTELTPQEHRLVRDATVSLDPGPDILFSLIYMSLGDYDSVTLRPFGGLLWQPEFPGFMASPAFRREAEKLNAPAFWRGHGFPPQCRPLGDDDYECRMP